MFLRYLPTPLLRCLEAVSESFSAFSGGLWEPFSPLSLECTAPKFSFFRVRGFIGCCWGFPGVFRVVFHAFLVTLRGPTKALFHYFHCDAVMLTHPRVLGYMLLYCALYQLVGVLICVCVVCVCVQVCVDMYVTLRRTCAQQVLALGVAREEVWNRLWVPANEVRRCMMLSSISQKICARG